MIANDQTISYATGAMSVVANPGAGSVSLLALGTNPPVLRHLAPVPVSVIGPPTSIALHPTRPLAIVTRAMQAEVREGKMQHVPGRQVSLLNLAEEGGGVITTVAVGLQPSSVSISPDGSYALVTNRSDGTLSVLGVTETSLQERERVPPERQSWNKWNELARPDWLSMNLDSFQLSPIDTFLERIGTRLPLDGTSKRRARVRDPILPGQPFVSPTQLPSYLRSDWCRSPMLKKGASLQKSRKKPPALQPPSTLMIWPVV